MKVFYILFIAIHVSQAYSQTHFRNTHWGMSEAEVKKSETSDLLSADENGLLYETKVANLDAVIFYSFFSDKLAIAGYL